MKRPEVMRKHVKSYMASLKKYPKLAKMYRACFYQTWRTTLRPCEDGTVFVLTGDIPAMWLRDSTAQLGAYLPLAEDPEVARVLEGVLRRQFLYIEIDPYANAFNQEPNGHGHTDDVPAPGPWVFERKYEVDSLCYPLRFLYLYWKKSGREALVRELLPTAAHTALGLWRVEQHHSERSPYRFTRPHPGHPWSSIYNDGLGAPVSYTGMTWSGFRPSDDGCEYGYLTASNMFASVVLDYMAEMLRAVCAEEELAKECEALRAEIDAGIQQYNIVHYEKYGDIYACETDGFGHYNLLDDANVPSLLSIPYIGYASAEDELYQNTRRFLLGPDNPYYFEGKCARGIGSRHTPERHIWPMSLVMQGLTSRDAAEKRELLQMLADTTGGARVLHESFHADRPRVYTRKWFTWPGALFCEFVEKCIDEGVL